MKHGFLILTHFPPEKIHNQIKRLQSPDHYFFIHFDKKLQIDTADPFYIALQAADKVTLLKDRLDVRWGSFRIVDATLKLMREAIKQKDIGYLHLMSGECMPVKSISYIHEYFTANQGREFIEHALLTKKGIGINYGRVDKYHLYDFFNFKSKKGKDILIKFINTGFRKLQLGLNLIGIYRKYPKEFPALYHGSQWWSLSIAACSYIVDYADNNKKFYTRMHYVLVPDEMFLQTILMRSPYKEMAVNDNLRFFTFKEAATSPVPVTIDNLPDVNKPNVLFARKFTNESKELLTYLDKHVY